MYKLRIEYIHLKIPARLHSSYININQSRNEQKLHDDQIILL